jgi:EAL and modified HD-GYP domain-containing signal transduction protein
VETEKDFKNCLDDGYELFQGFFFAKPQLVTGHKVDSDTAAILHILQILRGEPTLDVIEKTFAKQPEIEHSLLKYINAAAVERRTPIVNVRDAISWIGIYISGVADADALCPQRWVTLADISFISERISAAKFWKSAFAVDPHGELPAKAFIRVL